MKDYPAQHRLEFEQEWSKALNRFTGEFINDFCTAEGAIDWEKLVRFNSAKQEPTLPKLQKVDKSRKTNIKIEESR